jgi:hypothetical protein
MATLRAIPLTELACRSAPVPLIDPVRSSDGLMDDSAKSGVIYRHLARLGVI